MLQFAFVFPGQGSQAVGMGQALAQRFAVAAMRLPKPTRYLNFALSRLCFRGPGQHTD